MRAAGGEFACLSGGYPSFDSGLFCPSARQIKDLYLKVLGETFPAAKTQAWRVQNVHPNARCN